MWWRARREEKGKDLPKFFFFFRKQAHCYSQPVDILKSVTKVPDHERHVIRENMVNRKFLLLYAAPGATVERAFAMPRRVKKLLREDMNRQTFNHVAIL